MTGLSLFFTAQESFSALPGENIDSGVICDLAVSKIDLNGLKSPAHISFDPVKFFLPLSSNALTYKIAVSLGWERDVGDNQATIRVEKAGCKPQDELGFFIKLEMVEQVS